MLNRRDFYHQNIRYSFHYHKSRLEKINQLNQDYKKLKQFFQEIYKGRVPNQIFNMKNIQRISNFKLKGIKGPYLRSYSKQLVRTGKIIKFDSDYKLSRFANEVYQNFLKNKINKNPGHDPILKNILIRDRNSIAIETPIWKKINGEYITGHIDLIEIKKEMIKIVDYKPEGNFLYSLPQVASYGLLFKSIFSYNNVKCISFNKNHAWEYNPEVLIEDLKEYLSNHKYNTQKWEKFIE
ncbi:MAG: hypothetical protein R6W84_07490 [Promethearchaeia archaeon]